MITVTIRRDADARIKSISAMGHADYAEHGRDIVCAAVTAVMATAITAMTDVIGITVEYKTLEGQLELKLNREQTELHDAQLVMRATELGIRQITAQYGAYLKVVD